MKSIDEPVQSLLEGHIPCLIQLPYRWLLNLYNLNVFQLYLLIFADELDQQIMIRADKPLQSLPCFITLYFQMTSITKGALLSEVLMRVFT